MHGLRVLLPALMELSHTWASPQVRRTASARGAAPGAGVVDKERVPPPPPGLAWPLAVSWMRARFFHIQKCLRNFVFFSPFFFFFLSFFIPGQMSAPDRKHDWIEYKTPSLSVPPSRARWRCRGAGAAPRTELRGSGGASAHPRRPGVVRGSPERGHGEGTRRDRAPAPQDGGPRPPRSRARGCP